MKRYFALLAGQAVSSFGSALTGFALSLWVLEQTGSLTRLSVIVTSATLPELLILPFAGALIDRYSRRALILIADSLAALATVGVVALLASGSLELWMIPILVTLSSIAGGVQGTAFEASMRQLVRKEQLGRASGLGSLNKGLIVVSAPAVAGILLHWIGLRWILLVDLATFLFAAVVTWMYFPSRMEGHGGWKTSANLVQDVVEGWRYLRGRGALMKLMGVYVATQMVMSFTTLLYMPVILGFTTSDVLGFMMTAGAVGMIAGGLLVSWLGVPSRRIPWMMGGLFLGGLLVAASGLRPSTAWVTTCLAVAMFIVPVSKGSATVLWQVKLAPAVQGRIFAMQRTIARAIAPLAYLAAGPTADRLFEPLLREGGPLAHSLGRWIGVGPGRGTALLLIVTGLLTSLIAIVAYAVPDIRRIDRQVPDEPSAGDYAARSAVRAMDPV